MKPIDWTVIVLFLAAAAVWSLILASTFGPHVVVPVMAATAALAALLARS
jgi:hypothetical protein